MRNLLSKAVRRLHVYWSLIRARPASEARMRAGNMRRILVVCYGNIYRSAFLGEYLRTELADAAQVRSAGFHPKPLRGSPQRHIELAARLGVSLARHASAVVSPDDLHWADTIVLMDRHNCDALLRAGADSAKFVWIGALGPGNVEIVDPYRLGDDAAEGVTRRLLDCGRRFVDEIRSAQQRPPDA